MADKNLIARIGQVTTKGKHKERFLFSGVVESEEPREKFFYLLEITSQWVDGEKIRNTISGALQRNVMLVGDRTAIFEGLIKDVNAALGELSQSGEHEWVGKLNAIIGLISGDQLIFSQTGNIPGYLFRSNKISHITEKAVELEEPHPLKTFISLIDGNVAAGDKIIIANSELFSHFSLDRLRQIVANLPYREAIDEIAKALRRSKEFAVNLLIFDFPSGEEELSESDKPEMIILDQIPDSTAIRYSKLVLKGLGSGAKSTGRGAQKLAKYWQSSVGPKIKKTAKNTNERMSHSLDRTESPAGEKFSASPRINYFNKKHNAGFLPVLKSFADTLIFWAKSLLKPENRKYLYILIIVALLVIGFVNIQFKNKNNGSVATQSTNLDDLNKARNEYSQALTDIGKQKSNGKTELIAALADAKKAENSAAISAEAKNLVNQIQVKLDSLNNATRITAGTSSLFSISDSESQVLAAGAVLYSFASDGKITSYDTRTKSSSNILTVNSSSGKIKNVVYSETNNCFLIYTDKPEILKFNLVDKSISEEKISDNSSWKTAVAIGTYTGNVYLLDSENGKIWKYLAGATTFSSPTSYASKPAISLVGSVDLSIDGNLYVLQGNGSVVKITKGAEDTTFSLGTIPTPDDTISKPMAIYASSDTSSIFIMDAAGNRLLQFSKTGTYQKQYVLDGLTLQSFAVNGKLAKLWLLAGGKVFEENL